VTVPFGLVCRTLRFAIVRGGIWETKRMFPDLRHTGKPSAAMSWRKKSKIREERMTS
jgi:hypothetical protein